ncbi:MAG TPA: mechanosensitive ion channel family protein [Rhodanobacteraceae bacterium]|nr:mechanosensitive ion channel family protein [Rhodanobacteraceae bacterium]
METLANFLAHPWAHTLVGAVVLVAAAWGAAWLAHFVLARLARAVSRRTAWAWDDALARHGVFRHLVQVLPMLILRYGVLLVPGVPAAAERVVAIIATALAALFVVLACNAALSAVDSLYSATPRGREHSIKGYVQLGKILLWLIGVIVIAATLVDRSALSLLAGLGAISAVLLLIFKDTILSVVASVQIGSYDMLRVGDWIALPEDNVDGDVVEISLNTVKVVNWDKTLSTIPTWHLISKSYRNYRNMYATGRRIRRALDIDITSVRCLTPEEIEHLGQFKLLDGYFQRKQEELAGWNRKLGDEGWDAINDRRLTNLGTFRAYMQAYIGGHPGINQDLFWAVRQLDPTPTGIPLQVYAYTRNTSFVPHENVQGDIFDHLITILPEFGLELFQQPSGADLRAGLSKARDPRRLDAADPGEVNGQRKRA